MSELALDFEQYERDYYPSMQPLGEQFRNNLAFLQSDIAELGVSGSRAASKGEPFTLQFNWQEQAVRIAVVAGTLQFEGADEPVSELLVPFGVDAGDFVLSSESGNELSLVGRRLGVITTGLTVWIDAANSVVEPSMVGIFADERSQSYDVALEETVLWKSADSNQWKALPDVISKEESRNRRKALWAAGAGAAAVGAAAGAAAIRRARRS